MGRIINRELVSVFAAVGLCSMAMSITQPMLPLYLKSIGVTPAVIGLMFSLQMVGTALGEGSGGWLADKVGIRLPFAIGSLLTIPFILLMTLTVNIPFIFVIFMLWGIVRAFIFAPSRGYIGAKIPATHKATYLAIYSAAMTLSRSLGSFLGGYISEHFGYHWMFYAASMVVCLGGLCVVFILRKIPWRAPALLAPPAAPSGAGFSVRAPYRSRPFVTQCAVAVLCWISMGIVGPFVPLLAAGKIGISETEVGLLFTINSLVGAAFQVPFGRLADLKNKKSLMMAGLLTGALGFLGIAYSGSYGWLVGGLIVWSLGNIIFNPAAVALLSETVPLHWQNTAMGVYGVSEDIGVIIGAALGGLAW